MHIIFIIHIKHADLIDISHVEYVLQNMREKNLEKLKTLFWVVIDVHSFMMFTNHMMCSNCWILAVLLPYLLWSISLLKLSFVAIDFCTRHIISEKWMSTWCELCNSSADDDMFLVLYCRYTRSLQNIRNKYRCCLKGTAL